MSKKKILLITHQTSKTGAPYTIFLIFKEILKRQDIELDVLALSSIGDLKSEFEKISTNFYYPEKYYGYKKTKYEKLLSLFKLRNFDSPIEIIKQEITKNNYDTIYANTVLAIPIAIELNIILKTNLIAHIHELNHSTLECLPDLTNYVKNINFFLVPSDENKDFLIREYHVKKSNIKICRAASNPPDSNFSLIENGEKFNIYMCGTTNWRKGEDIFILLANAVIKQDNTIHFYWIGSSDEKTKTKTEIELSKLKTKDNIHFLGETDNVYELIQKMNCFILTSREDPFPLAAIEAGMAGLPILCFNEGNGIKEVLIDKDLIIDYLDIEKMKNKILELKNNSSRLKSIGENNKQTFNEYTPEKISQITLKHLI